LNDVDAAPRSRASAVTSRAITLPLGAIGTERLRAGFSSDEWGAGRRHQSLTSSIFFKDGLRRQGGVSMNVGDGSAGPVSLILERLLTEDGSKGWTFRRDDAPQAF
jgi:hypothetical protein